MTLNLFVTKCYWLFQVVGTLSSRNKQCRKTRSASLLPSSTPYQQNSSVFFKSPMRNHMLQVNINSRNSHWEILYIWQSCFVLLLLENQVRAFSILETFFKAAWCLFIRVVSVLALERLLQKTTDKKLRYWLHECLQALLVVSPQQPGHSELAPATSMAPPSLWIRSLSNFSGSF